MESNAGVPAKTAAIFPCNLDPKVKSESFRNSIHHGSKGSSSSAFLEAMPLKAAFISYGKDNSYGHPSGQVTEEMKKQNISLYETGGKGAWTLESKAGNVIIKRTVKSRGEN